MRDSRAFLLSLLALTAYPALGGGNGARNASIKVSPEAFDWAATLITQNHFVADKKGAWTSDQPTRAKENDFVRDRGFGEYAKWYLGIDERHAVDSKARYKFPFGDFRNVHRCGLLAIKARAHEHGHQDIENAAAELLGMIESTRPARQKRVD